MADARLVSVELDAERARLAADLFSGLPHVAHADLDAAELRLAPDLAALVATRRFPG